MDNINPLLTLDSDYTEVLTEHGMDQDIRKVLKEMAEAIAALATHYAPAPPTSPTFEGTLVKLEERSNWHRTIGWGIAGLYGMALLAILTWWIPREVSNAREGIKADTAAQLLPLQIQLSEADRARGA